MSLTKNSTDPYAFISQINPQIAQLSKMPNLKQIAEQMAQQSGIDLNQLIKDLTS